jgi:hypothetical protein
MAKARIDYDLSDPDDYREFKQAVASSAMASALFELIYNTKKKLEFELDSKEDIDKYGALEIVFEKIQYILSKHNINTEELFD